MLKLIPLPVIEKSYQWQFYDETRRFLLKEISIFIGDKNDQPLIFSLNQNNKYIPNFNYAKLKNT